MQSAFNRMDLVTREEFDVQIKVLALTREKVEALQATITRFNRTNNRQGKIMFAQSTRRFNEVR